MTPDLIIHNARFFRGGSDKTDASALAVWRGRICAVGADDEVLPHAGAGTRVVDMQGRFVCPGLIDCHVHLTSWAMQASGRSVNLDGAESLAEALERVRQAARRTPAGGWVRGRGWDKNHWTEGRFPTAADLDAVTGDIPAALPSHDGHSVWVNTAAMRLAGVPERLDDPPAGRIIRDEEGRPTGVFQESAMGSIWERVPEPDLAEITAALKEALPQAGAMGITSLHNCERSHSLPAVQALRDAGELTLRVTLYFPAESLQAARELGLRSGFGDEWVRIGGLKAFLDGALGSQTAAMLEPYEGSENRGVLMMEQGELEELIWDCERQGLVLALHAIGDRAVRVALDAFERTATTGQTGLPAPRVGGLRHRLEHAQHFDEADIGRPARLGIGLSMQPVHMLADIATCERQVGARGRWAFPLRSLLDAGAVLGFGSDAPVEVMDPWRGIQAAVLRRGHGGTPAEGWYPRERLSVEEALHGYTLGAAQLAGEEHLKGTLEVGKLADFVVLEHDPRELPAEELEGVRVLATVVGGEVVWDPEGVMAG